ncbi:MAG: TIGR04211 family SH3 domain-containing protein [Gammaproteobacteria bacterium]
MRFRRLTLICGLLLVLGPALAKTQYVSDELVITLRTGQGNNYQIIKTLSSGTRLEVLEETTTGYTRVRHSDGTEGWVRTQYLSDQPTAREQLASTRSKLEKLEEKNATLSTRLATMQQDNSQLSSKLNELSKQHKQAETDLNRLNEVAAKPILLDRENRELKEQTISLNNELQLLKQENQLLKDRSDRDWFIAGAGVLLGGILLGLLAPKLRRRKKDSWDF